MIDLTQWRVVITENPSPQIADLWAYDIRAQTCFKYAGEYKAATYLSRIQYTKLVVGEQRRIHDRQ